MFIGLNSLVFHRKINTIKPVFKQIETINNSSKWIKTGENIGLNRVIIL
jgi:hypothetical protein